MASRKELVGALGALLRRLEACKRLDEVLGGTSHVNAVRVFASAARGNVAPLPWTPLKRLRDRIPTEKNIADTAKTMGLTMDEARAQFAAMLAEEETWGNDTYQVSVRRLGPEAIHLSVKRNDQETLHDWRDLQRIKNELCGPEAEAVEIYPAESRKVDTANQYHLWVTTHPDGFRTIGFDEGRHVDDDDDGSHHQRPGATDGGAE